MEADLTKEQLEKELMDGIKETDITCLSRELLDDKRICYLVLTSQLLGLRQGYNLAIQEVLEDMRDITLKDTAESYSFRLKKKQEKKLK
jgi:hypothetical protein